MIKLLPPQKVNKEMNTHHDIDEELSALRSPLAGMSRRMPYELPEGYFAQFADQFFMHADLDTELSGLPKTITPFSVPEGYFETNPAAILKALENEGLEALPATMPFEIPNGYFDTLPAQIIAAAQSAPAIAAPGKTNRRIRLWASVRWAAAAVLITGIGFGSYNILDSQKSVRSARLSAVPSDNLGAYMQQNIDDFDGEMLETNVASAKNAKIDNYHTELSKVGNDEIIQYLNETGGDKAETN
jgi:hypothetical protein